MGEKESSCIVDENVNPTEQQTPKQECKTSHANGRRRVNKVRKVNMIHVLYKYEYGTFKLVEVTIRRGLR
jgi:hypothetical protein